MSAAEQAVVVAELPNSPAPKKRRGRPRKYKPDDDVVPSAVVCVHSAEELPLHRLLEPETKTQELAVKALADFASGQTDASRSQDSAAMVKHFLAGKPRRAAPVGVEAESLGMHRLKFVEMTFSAASAAVNCAQALIGGLCKQIRGFVQPPGDVQPAQDAQKENSLVPFVADVAPAKPVFLLGLVREIAFDETPTNIRIPEAGFSATGKPRLAKVLQSEANVVVVMKEGHPVGKEQCIQVRVPTWLQAMQNCTADVTRACVREIWRQACGVDALAAASPMDITITTTDRGSANLRAESAARRDAPCNQCRLELPCDVHKTSTCCTALFNLAGPEISGIIAMGLSQRPGGMTALLRSCVRELLRARLHVVRSEPNWVDGNAVHRRSMLQLFCGGDANAGRRATLASFLNGRWGKRRIEHVCGSNCCNSRRIEVTGQKLDDVAHALVPHGIRLFPRHRWTVLLRWLAGHCTLGPKRDGR